MNYFSYLQQLSPAKAIGKKRRGRPPKNSPRFIKKSKQASAATTATGPTLTTLSSATPSSVPTVATTKTKRVLFSESLEADKHPAAVPAKKTESQEPATLEGKRNIDDLRILFKEWIR